LCEQFLEQSQRNPPLLREEILDAIEKHDRKESLSHPPLHYKEAPSILTLLTLADDMDALGIRGIYRYAEIYLMRGIPLPELGLRILQNAFHRYQRLAEATLSIPAYKNEAQKGYERLEEFFNGFNQQLMTVDEPANLLWGPLGVVNLIRVHCVEKQVHPEAFFRDSDMKNYGRQVEGFFSELIQEGYRH
jgi:hypothetical protein